jgi:glycosyltransferase involved in cell wall biosynthesis
MNSKVKVAFPLFARNGWTGGLVHQINILKVIQSRLSDEVEASVFLSQEEFKTNGSELAPLVNGRLIVDASFASAGRGGHLGRALILGRDAPFEAQMQARGFDVVFEVASFYGARFGVPVIAFLADFQHRHMPEMFGRLNWWRRDLGFRTQIRTGRTLMVSSLSARDDLERFYPSARARGHVVRFAIDLDINPFFARGEEMRATYQLPSRFFYLPNQFWRHKNHDVIVAALARLKANGALEGMPPIILTGQSKDPRHPGYFDGLMAAVRSAGIGSHFRYLGLIPYDHVLALNATCDVLINPSKFEGLSLPIQEAKAFGTPLMLSDIAIHREQAPGAHFFKPESSQAAADALLEISRRPPSVRASLDQLITAQNARLDDHAASLLRAVQACTQGKRS